MAFNSYYNMLWKRQHRFGIALTLLVYSVCYLICDYFYINHAILAPQIDINKLYIVSLLLITMSTLLLIIFDSILNNNHTIIRILISILMIIGGLLYMTLTAIQSLQRHENNQENALLYTLLYVSSAFFISSNTIILGIINLLECYLCKTILLINSFIFIITSFGMIYFWSIYYKYSSISPTQIQIGLIQSGWIIIITVCFLTVIYEFMNSKHIPFLRILSVLLIIGSFLVFAGSSAFSADIIFFNDDNKNNFIIENNIEIVIEWSLSFCIFIACITLSALIMRSTKNKHFTHSSKPKKKSESNTHNVLFINRFEYGFDIMLETEPQNKQWADV